MIDSIELETAPWDEECAQVGEPRYYEKATKEAKVHTNQIWRWIKESKGVDKDTAPKSFKILTKSFSHDYGSYLMIVIKFDDTDNAAIDLAFELENNLPGHWDYEAKKELGLV